MTSAASRVTSPGEVASPQHASDDAVVARAPARPRRRFGVGRILAMLVVILSAGAAIAVIFWPKPPPPPPPPIPPPKLEVTGERLNLEGDPVADALDLVRRYVQQELVVVLPDGTERAVTPSLLGAEIDRGRLGAWVQAALDENSALRRGYEARRATEADAVLEAPVPVRIDRARSLDVLLGFKVEVDRVASDAAVDLAKKTLIEEKIGYRLDVYGTLARIDQALRQGRSKVEAAALVLEPKVKAAQLGNVQFDHVLGYFETRYSRARRHQARTYNLRLAASRLDGTVLLPGETFDFNATVGPRDEANGYRVAPVIAQGELVDGIGGGTCQISGTLHGAAFFSGLELVERVPHSRPSSYIKLGLDAAVAYPSINFALRNNFDFPVVLHEVVAGGKVRAEILGPPRKRTVTLFRRIDDVIPFEVEERETDDIPSGERVLSQRGVPGFEVTVYRLVREGAYAVREKIHTKYPPTTQIVKVGTGPRDAKGSTRDDGHPEYKAAEFLLVEQGPGARGEDDDPGGPMFENRIQGETGVDGWQKKAGMPVFESGGDDDDED